MHVCAKSCAKADSWRMSDDATAQMLCVWHAGLNTKYLIRQLHKESCGFATMICMLVWIAKHFIRHTPEEGRRVQRSKRVKYNSQDVHTGQNRKIYYNDTSLENIRHSLCFVVTIATGIFYNISSIIMFGLFQLSKLFNTAPRTSIIGMALNIKSYFFFASWERYG